MKYIHIDGQVIPKHCIYGPRQAEGIVFSDYEWWRITDHLVKDQREKDFAAAFKAKEEAKIELSHDMTRDWSNTLASIKTLGNQKRLEKKEREKQDKIDQYNAILKHKEEERRRKCEEVRRTFFEEKDAVKSVNMAVLYSLVLEERNKQIERKNQRKAEEAIRDKEIAEKLQKDAENFKKELEQEIIEERNKKIRQRQFLDLQMEDRKRRKQKEIEEFEAAKQDLIRMRMEDEKIQNCEALDKIYRKNFAKKFLGKTEKRMEFERKLALEQEVEDDINQIYLLYDRKIKKERRCREQQLTKEEAERRRKISEFLGERLVETSEKEQAILTAAEEERERRLQKEEEERQEKRRKLIEDRRADKKRTEEEAAIAKRRKEEERKWGLMQQYRSAEVNEERRCAEMRHLKAMKEDVRKGLDCQKKQLEERRALELKERLTPLENEVQDMEDLKKHCEDVMTFAREHCLPEGPIRTAIAKVKKIENIVDKNEEQQQKKEEAKCRQQKLKTMASGCYCLKY